MRILTTSSLAPFVKIVLRITTFVREPLQLFQLIVMFYATWEFCGVRLYFNASAHGAYSKRGKLILVFMDGLLWFSMEIQTVFWGMD